jgi:hypothetical protein
VGDAVDFWRVEALEPGRQLRLRAEMHLPGRAWLQFDVESVEDAPPRTQITQTVFFEPKGLGGTLYWNLVRPLHGLLFSGLLRKLTNWIEARDPDVPDIAPVDPPVAEMRE